ncbi:MAG: hypothetical protein WCP28_08020 [Actinomycetes bacterium]
MTETSGKSLRYRAGPIPVDLDNSLLDIEVSYGTFLADQVSMGLMN